MSKKIKNYFELKNICRSAGLWYIGSFMMEFLDNREMWENKDTKQRFIAYMHNKYEGTDKDFCGTRTRVNCIIRIIESGYVKDALKLVLQANDNKLGCDESKINAQILLDAFERGEYME